MSLKIYNKENNKWEKAGSLLASSMKVIDTKGHFESENVEGCLDEIATDMNLVKKDLKYIYENGTMGGGGGGGGGSSMPTIKIDGELDEQGIHQRVVKSDEVIDIYYFFNSPNAGNGTVELSYGSTIIKETIKQGRNKWTVGAFPRGTHNLSIVVEDRQGFVSDPARIRVISGALEITSTFSDAEDFNLMDDITIPYRVLTEIPDTITAQLTLNGETIEKIVNKGDNYWNIGNLPTLGVHTASIKTYCETAESNTLSYTLVASDSERLFVSTKFNEKTFPQGKNLQVDYRISMKNQYQFKSELWLNGNLMDTVRNPSGVSYWNLGNDLPIGVHRIKIVSMTLDEVHKDSFEIEVEIVESGLLVIPEPVEGLIAKFDANGKSNNSDSKNVWEDKSGNGVNCKLYGFNYATNGWVTDDVLDQTVLKFSGKTYAEIDLAPFKNGIETGFTFDVFFKVNNTGNMDAKVLSCKNMATPYQGFMIDTEKALLEGRQSVKAQFQEDTWTRVTFVIDRVGKTIRTYTNAIMSNVSMIAPRDPQQDEFTFGGNILLGANRDVDGEIVENSTCSIRTLRVYNRALTSEEILNIHMYDIKNADELDKIYQLNYGEIAIPTMTITSVGIENLEPDQDSIGARIDYVDPANPNKRFTKDLCKIAIQGTTSRFYPVKNYTIWLNENDGQPTRDYAPLDEWMPESRWTLKTNYMDSSHANNVGLCKFFHDMLKDKPYPQQQVNPKTRSCPDGQPVKVIVNGKDCGVYTWNIDRYAHNNYGFVTYNEDGTVNRHNSAVSYEVAVNSTNGAGAFNDDSWDSIRAEFKHRYNYRGDDVTVKDGNDTVLAQGMHTELQELVSWVRNVSDDDFVADVTKYFSLPHLIDYFLGVYAFGLIDSLGKNMVLTTFGRNEDGHMIWYPSFYDADTCLGLANNGELRYDAGVDMDADAFNTRTSGLWTKLRRNFHQQIKDRYVELRRTRNINGEIHPPIFSEENVMKYLYGEVIGKIGQRYYNDDAERKYVNDAGSTWLIACNGTREDFTRRWLKERFIYLDSVYENGDFNNKTMVLRTNVLGNIKLQLKTYSPMWVRINYTSSQSKKIYVNKNKFYDFEVNMTNDSENDFTIYGAGNLMYVNNMESLNVSHISISGAEKLIEVNCSESEHIKGLELGQNKYLQRVICNDCKRLGEEERDRHLNLSGCQNLKEVNCSNTQIATLSLPEEGGVLELLDCSNSGLTSFTMKGQEYLEELDLASCINLSSMTLENCDGLKKVDMPNTIISNCIIRGCENLEDINISNTKRLEVLDLQGCPNLKKLNLSGVLSTTLRDLDLTASLNLEELNISSTAYIETITFGQYRDESGQLANYNALKVFNCANSGIKAIRYGKLNPIPDYMDLNGLNLEYITFDSCSNIKHIKNIDLVAKSSMSPFKACANLETIEGRIKLVGSINNAFHNCRKLKNIHNTLDLDLTEVTSMSETFLNCLEFTWDEVKFILSKVSSKFTNSGWKTFCNCTGIEGNIPSDLFSQCTGLQNMSHFFQGCTGITGELPPRLLEPCKKLSVLSYAFNRTQISGAIPNDFLRYAGSSLTTIDNAFSNTKIDTVPTSNLLKFNTNIKSCSGAFSGCKEMMGELPNELFKDKGELTDVGYMFNGCSGIYGEIPRDLFRNAPTGKTSKINTVSYMLRGTGIYGEIPSYVSESNKGIFDELPELVNVDYFFPTGISGEIPSGLFRNNGKLVKVSGLFSGCTGIIGEIPSGLFTNTPNISLIDKVFRNCTGLNSYIPKGFLDNCPDVVNVSELFYGCAGLKGQIPERVSEWIEVPSEEDPEIMDEIEIVHEYGLFDNCKVLANANGLFYGCKNLHSTIPETLFISGQNITDLSYIFYRCHELYGQIPEKLFENCRKVIKLDYAFTDCCRLGKTSLEVTEDDPYAIPPKLFTNCRELATTVNMFSMWGNNPYSNTLRGSLHKNMFRTNSKLSDINTMFGGCGLITGDLDGDFFAGNPNLTNCSSTFYGTKFNSVGSKLLSTNTKINNISYMFKGNNTVTGNAPKLWQTPAMITTECFNGCTFADQESIPATYK